MHRFRLWLPAYVTTRPTHACYLYRNSPRRYDIKSNMEITLLIYLMKCLVWHCVLLAVKQLVFLCIILELLLLYEVFYLLMLCTYTYICMHFSAISIPLNIPNVKFSRSKLPVASCAVYMIQSYTRMTSVYKYISLLLLRCRYKSFIENENLNYRLRSAFVSQSLWL